MKNLYKSLNKAILKLAAPNILANLSVPLLSVVDLSLMGHLDDEKYILSVGFGVMIFNFIYWGFGFLRMGVTGMTAQEVGKGDVDESYRLLFRGLLIALLSGVLLFLIKSYLLQLSIYLIDTSSSVNTQLTSYFNVRIFAAPATLGLYVFIGWFLGKQNAKIPMFITISVNVLNAVVSYYLVTNLNMKTKGIALGTVLAQYIGLTIAIFFFLFYYQEQLKKQVFNEILAVKKMKKFASVNSDIIIRTLCLIFTFSFFKVMSTKQGDVIGAANILLLEFTAIAAYGIDGFAFAAESISGKYFGAKDKQQFKVAVRLCFYWGLTLGCLYTCTYFIFGSSILELLTDQIEVREVADNYLVWLIVFPILSVFSFIWDGVFIGVTASKAMRNTMLFSTFIVFLPSYYLLSKILGNHGLWLAMILFIVSRGLTQTIISKKAVYNKML